MILNRFNIMAYNRLLQVLLIQIYYIDLTMDYDLLLLANKTS